MADRRSSVLLSVLYGDCLGAPYEFSLPDPSVPLKVGPSVFGHPSGRGTDDTETTLAVAHGLLDAAAAGQLHDPVAAIAERLLVWCDTRPPDVGNTTRAGLDAYRRTRDPLTAGLDIPHSVANGSLMRSAPFVLAYAHPDTAAAVAARSSMVTHRHPTVLACVDAYVRLVHALLDGSSLQPGAPAEMIDAHAVAMQHRDRMPADIPCSGIGHAVYALTLAWWAALSPLADGFERGMELVVRAGGDTDTNAAICGPVLAARHGMPQHLVAQLDADRVAEVTDLTARLLALR